MTRSVQDHPARRATARGLATSYAILLASSACLPAHAPSTSPDVQGVSATYVLMNGSDTASVETVVRCARRIIGAVEGRGAAMHVRYDATLDDHLGTSALDVIVVQGAGSTPQVAQYASDGDSARIRVIGARGIQTLRARVPAGAFVLVSGYVGLLESLVFTSSELNQRTRSVFFMGVSDPLAQSSISFGAADSVSISLPSTQLRATWNRSRGFDAVTVDGSRAHWVRIGDAPRRNEHACESPRLVVESVVPRPASVPQ